MQGWRTTQEDAHVTIPVARCHRLDACAKDLGGALSGVGMRLAAGAVRCARGRYAVYDGHGGREVAAFCERHMPKELLHAAKRGPQADPAQDESHIQ